MNGTMRRVNRTIADPGAAGGVALLAVTLVFTGAVVVAMCSPLRMAVVW